MQPKAAGLFHSKVATEHRWVYFSCKRDLIHGSVVTKCEKNVSDSGLFGQSIITSTTYRLSRDINKLLTAMTNQKKGSKRHFCVWSNFSKTSLFLFLNVTCYNQPVYAVARCVISLPSANWHNSASLMKALVLVLKIMDKWGSLCSHGLRYLYPSARWCLWFHVYMCVCMCLGGGEIVGTEEVVLIGCELQQYPDTIRLVRWCCLWLISRGREGNPPVSAAVSLPFR